MKPVCDTLLGAREEGLDGAAWGVMTEIVLELPLGPTPFVALTR